LKLKLLGLLSDSISSTPSAVLRNPKQPRVEPVAVPHDDATATALAELGPPIALFGVFARRPDRAHAIAQWGNRR
jgi:hypothetical protein